MIMNNKINKALTTDTMILFIALLSHNVSTLTYLNEHQILDNLITVIYDPTNSHYC